jgi:serine/threonine protein kinase
LFHPHSVQPGQIFAGDFRVEQPLAMGGMGAVYVVTQLSTGRKRALKLMLPSLVENPRTRERFEQEARIGSRIQSDHVVEVVAAGIDPESGAPWLAMELLEGETLAQRIARSGPLGPAVTLEVFRQLCHGLGAAHAIGLVHRDIKPENLYLAVPRREGVPFTLKILDFGIAKLGEDVRGSGSATGAVGSPLWMAPEQTDTSGVGPPADVWALGLVAFFCLTGLPFWRAANSAEATLPGLFKEVLVDPVVPAGVRAAELGVAQLLPFGFDAWFSRTVVRQPGQRFADAARALAELHVVLAPPAPTIGFDTASGAPAVAATLPRNPSYPDFRASSPGVTAPAAKKGSKAWLWVVAGLFVLLAGGVVVAAAGGVLFGYYYTAEAPSSKPSASSGAPAATATVSVAATDPIASSPDPGTGPTATAPGAPRSTAAVATGGDKTASAASPSATSTAIVMNDVDLAPKRDYKLAWYNQKIKECWKGNEGAKPDAGSYSVTVTVKLTEIGQATSIAVNPRTYKGFAGCAVTRSSEHPWGKGPAESKSFSFSF